MDFQRHKKPDPCISKCHKTHYISFNIIYFPEKYLLIDIPSNCKCLGVSFTNRNTVIDKTWWTNDHAATYHRLVGKKREKWHTLFVKWSEQEVFFFQWQKLGNCYCIESCTVMVAYGLSLCFHRVQKEMAKSKTVIMLGRELQDKRKFDRHKLKL